MDLTFIETHQQWIEIGGGFLLLFFGWALYRVGLMFLCFFLGAIGGGSLAKMSIRMVESIPDTWWIVAVGIILGGIVGVLLLRKLFFLGIFVIAGLFAFNFKQTVLTDPWIFKQISMPAVESFWNSPLGTIVFAVLVALMVVALHRFIIILLSSGVGAMLVSENLPWAGAVYILFIAGLLGQFGLIKRFGIDTKRESGRWKDERIRYVREDYGE